jgi:hypothetical protein
MLVRRSSSARLRLPDWVLVVPNPVPRGVGSSRAVASRGLAGSEVYRRRRSVVRAGRLHPNTSSGTLSGIRRRPALDHWRRRLRTRGWPHGWRTAGWAHLIDAVKDPCPAERLAVELLQSVSSLDPAQYAHVSQTIGSARSTRSEVCRILKDPEVRPVEGGGSPGRDRLAIPQPTGRVAVSRPSRVSRSQTPIRRPPGRTCVRAASHCRSKRSSRRTVERPSAATISRRY